MSDKWRRSKAWDEAHLPAALWPVKAVLRAFSSITQAVCLLVLVVLYGISASVPVGLLALIPTYLLYALSAVMAVAIIAGLPLIAMRRLLLPLGRGVRFGILFALGIVLVAGSVYLWHTFAWPRLRYDALSGGGLRLFSGFVERHSATTLRRLPGLEMSELEYYSWWPMRAILLTFVLNMVVATVRRIDFTFRNIGVLTVHTGIITIALSLIHI